MPQSICLNMIVKDEEHVIESTLTNILDNIPITTWIISDTGSSDNTKKVISSFFKKRKIKGKIFDDEWKDFGHNRSKALEHAYDKSDYLLIFDADDSFSGNVIIPDNLTLDGYHLTFGSADYAYKRILLVNNRKRWKFEGVLHEYIAPIDHTPSFGDILGNYSVNSGKSGARSKDPDKYKKDALILEKAYYEAKSQDDDIYTRYGYYCAQSYHDARMKDEAIKWFKINLGDNGFIQEKVVSCIKLGDIYLERKDIAHAIYYWSKSLEVDNERFEGIYRIMQYYFNIRNFNMVINYYLMVCDQLDSNIPLQNKLFVDRTVYHYEIAWTVLLSAFYSNKPGYAIGAYKQLLKNFHRIPPERINDVFNNFHFYKNEIKNENIIFFNKFQNAVNYVHINYPGIVKRESLHSLYASIETLLNPYKVYPKQITQTLTKCISSTNTKMNTVFTITSCKRLDLFTQTMNSFMQNCTDISSISFFLCVDDNSSDKDRETMQRLYPFMHFYLKGEHEKGHRESMNIIWNKLDDLNPKYWMHMEDDWFFIKKEKYVGRSINALHQLESENVSQILFNRNYAEEFSDNAQLCGGKRADNNLLLHIHNEEGLRGPNSAYWPHYSFRPSLIKWATIKKLGNYDSQNQFFEKDYADKYTESGYKSAFYNEITCLHTGKLTREKDDPRKKNAYQLNGENQFDKASPTPKENRPNEPMIKVINLERRHDRKKDIEDKFKTAEIDDYEFVTALDGNELEPSEELSKLFNGNDFGSRCGVIGCALSHYYLWKEFIASSNREFIVIMEDDFNLTTNFKQHLSGLEERMNKENIIFLGYSMFDDRRATVRNLYDVTSDTIVVSSLNKDLYMGGTFAYSINKKGAEFMVKYIENHGIKHGIDYIIKHNADSPCECRPHIVFSPVCDGTNGIDSDIQTCMKQLSLDMVDYDEKYTFYEGVDYHGSDCEFIKDKSVDWLKREVFYRTDGVGFNTLGFIKNHIDLDNLRPSPYFNDNDGIYVKKNYERSRRSLAPTENFDGTIDVSTDDVCQKNTKVKMLCDWCSCDDLCKEWNNMRNNQDVCNTLELVSNSEIADYFVIINKPQKDDYYDPKRTIVFQMEPWVYDDNKKWGVKTWGEWAEPDESKFLYVGTHKKALNAVQWWVRDYPLLFPVERKDRVISMISNKLCDDGHIKRLNLSKQCDLVDIFGRENYHDIDKYKGSLKDDKKESEYVNYKYCLSIENNFEKNYATEKIWDGIMCECLCFYWGCPNLEDYIDSNAFIRLDLDNIEDSIKIIQKAIDEDWWTQRIDTIRKEKERLVNELGFFPVLEKLIATKTAF